MSKRTIIYLKKTDPESPQKQEAIYIHDDLVAKALAGDRSSPKVSDIRFDDGPKQEWVAVLRDGRELCRDKDRGVVVQMEADIIAKMFARGEYIPGGYNGEPRHKASASTSIQLEDLKYLGSHDGADLYSQQEFERSSFWCVFVLSNERVFNCRIIPQKDGHAFLMSNPHNHPDLVRECVRRHAIEMEIEREEKIKTQSHA